MLRQLRFLEEVSIMKCGLDANEGGNTSQLAKNLIKHTFSAIRVAMVKGQKRRAGWIVKLDDGRLFQ